MNEIIDYPKYVALQDQDYRYVYTYNEDQNKYHVTIEHHLTLGSSMSFDIATPEKALEKMEELKKKNLLQFRSPAEVSWYATRENNTPYDEQWEIKDGFLIPINSHSADVYTVSGTTCSFVEQWLEIGSNATYLLVQCKEDEDFYYARAVEDTEKYEYEFDHMPTRKEVEDTHIDNIAKIAINRQEEEIYERIYGTADRLAVEKEVAAEMKAETLFKTVLPEQNDNIKVKGHIGTWYIIENEVIDGKKLFLLEHETYGDEAACLIVDENAVLVMDEVWNGFDDYLEQVYEPLVEKCKAAMEIAGYHFNEIDSYDGFVKFDTEHLFNSSFESWQEVAEWLDAVVFDEPEVSNAVEQIMHPERFPGCERKGR